MGVLFLGYCRPFAQNRAPYVTDEDADVLGDCLVLDGFDGSSNTVWVPMFSAWYEFGLLPLNDAVCCV